MRGEETMEFSPAYAAWFGSLVLLFVVRECQIPVLCSIVGESPFALRISLQPGWEIDVPKELIMAVEQLAADALDPCMN